MLLPRYFVISSKHKTLAGAITTAILNTLGKFKAVRQGGKFFYSIGSLPSAFWGEQTYSQYLKDFIEIPELNAVINYKARAHSRVKFDIISKQTGKPVSNSESIIKVLRKPNWFQTTEEWLYQAELYKSIFGNEYHYFLSPVGMGKTIKAIYTLPPQHMFIKCTDQFFFLNSDIPEGVEYFFSLPDGEKHYPIEPNELLHLNNNRVSYVPDKHLHTKEMRTNYLYGTSKLASLTPALTNLRQAHEGRYTLRSLPAGILSNTAKDQAGAVPMLPEEKKGLHENMKKYGVSVDKNQLIITGLSLKLNETIVDIKKLMLYEETEEDTAAICDMFGVPFELVGSKTGITYENKKYAERQLYEDTIIPESAERIQALNNKLGTDSKSWEIVGTFDHLPIFQENQVERSQVLEKIVNALNKALQDGAIDIEIYKKELLKLGIGEG